MNPPTKGHERLVNKVRELAKDKDHLIFLSKNQNNTQDPLSWDYKLRIVEKAFPGANFSKMEDIKTPFQALEYLVFAEEYTDITFVVGGDRLQDFQDRMTPYAVEWGIRNFRIVSAGDRNPRSRSINGISGTRLRQYAYLGNESSFCEGLPNTINNVTKKQIFRDVRCILKI